MMPDSYLPAENHVVRYVRKRLLRKNEDGDVLGILPQALEHREGETYLSVTWLEHFSADYERGLGLAAEAIRRQLTVKPKDGFTMGEVGLICEICKCYDVKARVIHNPDPPKNTGYTELRGLRRSELALLDLLAAEAFTDTRVSSEVQISV